MNKAAARIKYLRPGHNLKMAKVKFTYTRVHLLCTHEVTSIVGKGLPRFLPPLGRSKFTFSQWLTQEKVELGSRLE